MQLITYNQRRPSIKLKTKKKKENNKKKENSNTTIFKNNESYTLAYALRTNLNGLWLMTNLE